MSFETAMDIVVNLLKGLEESYGEPIREEVPTFQYISGRMYYAKCYMAHNTLEVVEALIRNFGQDGKHFPLIGECRPMGTLNEKEVACKTSTVKPYPWRTYNKRSDIYNEFGRVKSSKGSFHAVLITGLYTMLDNPHIGTTT
ncbi:hypothetical protein L1987_59006 [Smallanthus sonchifolius]|uniref:Uncharacterized protein n=1 Tax=Smallanthus sonchifolius TaxID=185202 RepID=A0ACB9D434_9ASTR|nr:hypothetical protein L1987_59006 [Smallanthus sonchifolius]